MDRKFCNNGKLDDTETLSATIERSLSTQGHTEYVIRVQRGPLTENCWRTKKRYNDFVELQGALQVNSVELPFPPKKIFGNMEREFVNQRQQGLQIYLNTLLTHAVLSASLPLKRFLDPVNYFHNFQEKSYQQVLMMFRSDPVWNVVEAINDIGWRIRKHYFLIRQHQDPLRDVILSRSSYGPDACLNEKEANLILKYLVSFNHPLIISPLIASVDSTGGIAIYNYHLDGSLKDYIYKCQPRNFYLKKYKQSKTTSNLTISEIKLFGKHILEALQDLHSKGFPYGHLHAGNVFVDNGVCKISSLENSFLGLSPFYRNFATQLKKVKTVFELDVYSFGHLVYEMTFGQCLNTSTCDSYPSSCSPEIKSVLESILTTEACAGGLPTVDHLLAHPLFGDASSSAKISRNPLKMTSQMQELCKTVRNKIEQRLLNDQILMRKVQRVQRAQTLLQEEQRLGFKRNHSQVKKSKDNAVGSPAVGVGYCSGSTTPAPPPLEPELTNGSRIRLGEKQSSKNSAETPSVGSGSDNNGSSRLSLLSSIQAFSAAKLRKTVTNDRSVPRTE